MSTYVIVGGHGKVALMATRLLVSQHHRVNSIIRNADQREDIEALGAHPIVLDVQAADEDSMVEAFRDADAVVWSAGAGGGSADRTYGVDRDGAIRSMKAAERAHVSRYVMVSYWGAGNDLDRYSPQSSFYPYAKAKAAADAFLRSSALRWTILAPTGLNLDEPSGKITLGAPDHVYAELPATSRGNVARVIAAALIDDTTIGKTLSFHDGDMAIADAIHNV
jgi:uncharacterized protein YbjT (DUF2867 family)